MYCINQILSNLFIIFTVVVGIVWNVIKFFTIKKKFFIQTQIYIYNHEIGWVLKKCQALSKFAKWNLNFPTLLSRWKISFLLLFAAMEWIKLGEFHNFRHAVFVISKKNYAYFPIQTHFLLCFGIFISPYVSHFYMFT